MIGETLGHYRIQEKIGAGGMGVVYRAHDDRLDRDVAIKVLPRGLVGDESARRRFRKEALSLSKLNHPNIATIYDFNSQGDVDYLVMEYVPGQGLREKIAGGPLPVAELVRVAMELAEGLAAAHDRGLVHRDLKPENLRFTSDGRLKVLDFGLATLAKPLTDTSTTTEGSFLPAAGTPLYMSPEQVLGCPLDQRADLFSFGVVLYEMATGSLPFQGGTPGAISNAIVNKVPAAPLRFNPTLPPKLDEIISKALEKDPNLRYQHAADIRTDLQRLKRDTESKYPKAVLSSTTEGSEASKTGGRKLWRIIVSVLLVSAPISAGLYYYSRKTKPPITQYTIVLADFTNTTGDPVFDDTLKLALAADLEQTPFLNVVSEKKVEDVLHLMERPPDERISVPVAREICLRSGSTAVLAGSIDRLGSQYIIGLRALSCQSGDSLGIAQAEADSREKVLLALDHAATALRKKMGESLASIQKFDRPLQEVTTSSLEALRAYTEGTKSYTRTADSLIPLLQRAIELDPSFAIAYASLGTAYTSIGESELAIANFKKAYELSGGVSERERLYIATQYFTYVTGEVEKAIQHYQLWIREYPNQALPHLNLAPDYATLGRYEEAAAESKEANRIDPSLEGYVNLSGYYIFLNRLDGARAALDEAAAHKFEHPYLHLVRYYLAFVQKDDRGMQAQVADAMGTPGGEDLLLSTASDTEGFFGRLRKARELSRRAMESAKRSGLSEAAALWQVNAAIREAECGNTTEARAQVHTALALSSGRDVQLLAAVALARSREFARAQAMIQSMINESPHSTVLQSYWAPVIHAGIELSSGSPTEAIETLEAARPYELGSPPPLQLATMYPVYVRGEAYLTAHRGDDAAVEFQKIIDHSTIVLNFPLGALAHVGLARAYSLNGDKLNAKRKYEDFLRLWKDADPDIPIYQQARAEYAKLR